MITAILSDFSRTVMCYEPEGERLDEALLAYYASLKPTYAIALFTAVGEYDAPTIKGRMHEIFEAFYRTIETGLRKDDPESYRTIAAAWGRKPEEIIFIDDSPRNIAAAQEAGLRTVLHENTERTIREIAGCLGR